MKSTTVVLIMTLLASCTLTIDPLGESDSDGSVYRVLIGQELLAAAAGKKMHVRQGCYWTYWTHNSSDPRELNTDQNLYNFTTFRCKKQSGVRSHVDYVEFLIDGISCRTIQLDSSHTSLQRTDALVGCKGIWVPEKADDSDYGVVINKSLLEKIPDKQYVIYVRQSCQWVANPMTHNDSDPMTITSDQTTYYLQTSRCK